MKEKNRYLNDFHIGKYFAGILIAAYLCLLPAGLCGQTAWYRRGSFFDISTIKALFAWDSHRAIAAGNGGTIILCLDGGKEWHSLSIRDKRAIDFKDIFFINADTGWVVGDFGQILKTENRARDWKLLYSDLETNLMTVRFFDIMNGIAAGNRNNEAVIFHTADGGETWSEQTFGNTNCFCDIAIVSEDIAYAAGNYGVIYKTTDRGDSWNPLNSGTLTNISDLFFLNASTGWAVGGLGLILKTTDSGKTWIIQSGETVEPLFSVCFTDPVHGWAAGDNGTLIFTGNGGKSWTHYPTRTRQCLVAVQFPKQRTGWVISSMGMVFRTLIPE